MNTQSDMVCEWYKMESTIAMMMPGGKEDPNNYYGTSCDMGYSKGFHMHHCPGCGGKIEVKEL